MSFYLDLRVAVEPPPPDPDPDPTPDPTPVPVQAGVRPITAPESAWYRGVLDAPIDEAATPGVAAQMASEAQSGYLFYLSNSTYTATIYEVPADQPVVPVTLTNLYTTWRPLAQTLQRFGVPIPDGAHATGDSDDHLIIWSPDWVSLDGLYHGLLIELWKGRQAADGSWSCALGGRMTGSSSNPGHWFDRHNGEPGYTDKLPTADIAAETFMDGPWSASASGLPIAPGIIRAEDMARVEVGAEDFGHALFVTSINADYNHRWPAMRDDGNKTTAIQQGMQVRLDPSWPVPTTWDPLRQAVARTLQRYGVIYGDKSTGYPAAKMEPGGLQSPLWTHGYEAFKGIPASRMQVVDNTAVQAEIG